MKKSALFIVSAAVVFAIACRGDEDKLRRDQQEYDVVQEGAGGAVTSTLQAPGEVAPPLVPPLTGTNADTTTAFTLPTATDTTQSGPPGTIAGTFTTGTQSDPRYQASPRPAPAQRPPVPQPAPPQPVPPPTQTSEQEPQPPTTTQEPREEEPEPEREPVPQPQPEPQPAPPPTPPPG